MKAQKHLQCIISNTLPKLFEIVFEQYLAFDISNTLSSEKQVMFNFEYLIKLSTRT